MLYIYFIIIFNNLNRIFVNKINQTKKTKNVNKNTKTKKQLKKTKNVKIKTNTKKQLKTLDCFFCSFVYICHPPDSVGPLF